MAEEPLGFGVIGIDHPHVYAMAATLLRAGAGFRAFHAADPAPAEGFAKIFPMARKAADPREILEDGSIALVASAAVPSERAAIALACMRHGKDVLVDKPGAVTLDEMAALRTTQRETGRRYVIFYSERLESRATVRAAALVREGAIGRPLQTLGLGPHRLGAGRPDWFFDPARSGGILGDLASHQVDQFLWFTGERDAGVAAAQVANRAHPGHPAFEDFGELLLRGERATGYVRVDWFTPAGLPTWGDVRLTVLGTEGTLEVRKNCDLAGREGGDHLFLADASGVHHFDCREEPLPFGEALLRDVRERTEAAMPQEHCFRAQEIALEAQAAATRL